MTLRVYLDTSVFSAYFDRRWPERRRATREFWGRRRVLRLTSSELARHELSQAPDADTRRRLLRLLAMVNVDALSDEMQRLADRYVRAAVFSDATRADALHVAAAVVGGSDVLVSWNFRHLVNVARRAKVNEVNRALGLRAIEIVSPPEVR
jgi:predicted nucleic acid-binding protein